MDFEGIRKSLDLRLLRDYRMAFRSSSIRLRAKPLSKEDCDIFSPVHSNLGNMDGVELAFAKNGRSSRCKSLVQ